MDSNPRFPVAETILEETASAQLRFGSSSASALTRAPRRAVVDRGRGIPQEDIRRLILNPQTGKPLSIKTLERAFATEIKTAKTELDFKVGQFIMDSILGRTPVNAKPRKDDRERARLAIFYAKTRMGWKVTA